MLAGEQIQSLPAAGFGALVQDRQLLRLVNHLPGMAYRYRRDGGDWCMEFVSDGCLSLTGCTPAQLLAGRGSAYMELIHSEDRAAVINVLRHLSPDRAAYSCVYRIVTQDGTTKWVRDQGVGIFSDAGIPSFWEGFVLDITDEKQRQGILIRSDAEAKRLIQSIQDGVFLIRNDVLKFVNRTLADMLGYAVEELLGHDFRDFVASDYLEGIPTFYRELVGNSEASNTFELHLLHKDGITRIPATVNVVTANYSGPAILGTVKDVSLHHQVREARVQLLERVDQRHRTIIYLSKQPSVAEGNVEVALPLIAEEAARALQVAQVGIWRLDPGGRECRNQVLYNVASGASPGMDVLAIADYPACYRALHQGLVLDVADVIHDPRTEALTARYWEPHNIKAALQAPVWMRGEVVGFVCHGHTGSLREWTPDEIAFASQIADLVAQTFLNADIRRRADELAALTRVSQEISAIPDLQQVLDSIAHHAARLSNADVGTVFALQQNGEIALAGYGLLPASMQVLQSLSDALMWEGSVERALVERRPVQVYDATAEKGSALRGVVRNEGICSELVVPLLNGNDVIGGIILGNRQPRVYLPREIDFVQALAQQSVNAVENARLLGLERSQRERAEVLYGLAHSLIAFDRLPDLLRTVVESAVEALDVYWAMVAIIDDEERQHFDCVTGGAGAEQRVCSFERLWQGGADKVWQTGAPVIIDGDEAAAMLGEGIGAGVIVPLQYRDEKLGALAVVRQVDRGAFQEQDIALLSAMANLTATAMQGFRLLDSLNLEKIRLELLYRLGQHLSESLDVTDVCQLALDEVTGALEVPKGLVLIVDAESETTQVAATAGYDYDSLVASLRQGHRANDSLSGWAMEHRQVAIAGDVSQDDRWLPLPCGDDDVKSALSVPLLSGEVLVGVITLASTYPSFFTEEHCRLVESAAAAIAVAVNNALLFGRAERRASEQACVSDIARALNAFSIAEAFPTLFQGLKRLVACEQLCLALWDEESDAFIVEASTVEGLPHGTLLPLTAPIRALLLDAQPYLTDDPADVLDDTARRAVEEPSVRSHAVLPLTIGQQVGGLLYLASCQLLARSQMPVLQQTADMVAIATENERLFNAEQRQREVAERLQETALIVNTLDLQEVLKLILEQLESIFPYQGGTVQILEQDAMCVIALRDLPDDHLGRCYALKTHPYNRRLAEGEVVVIEDVLENAQGFLVDVRVPMRSTIGVPLWVRDKVIGALTIDSATARTYSEEDIRVIRVFAQQAAVAIENARLFEAQRVQREMSDALREAAAVMTSVLDFDHVLDQILDQAARVVPGDTFNIILVEGNTGRMIRWRGYEELGIPSTPASRRNMPINYPSLKKMLYDGDPVFVSDVRRDPDWVPTPGREILRSYVAAPIRIAGKTEGFLNVAGTRPNQFNPQDAERLKAFADQAAIALQNARLFQQTTEYAEDLERRVRERTLQLEAKNAWLEAIVSSTSDGIVVTDSDGIIVDANRVADLYLYHSLPAEEVARLRTAIRDLAHRAQERPDAVLEFSGLDLELRAAPILEQGSAGPAVVVAVHDVSYLKALDRMKTQFVSNVSHELRTPITSIRLYSSLLQRNPSAQRQQYFTALDQEAERLSKLVEDILRISRIEAGQLEVERHEIDLTTLAETAVLSHKALAESRSLTITYEALREDMTISADPDKFIQVLNNLIENAINYTPEHGHIAVSVDKRAVDGRAWATVTVRDTGMGISEDETEHIFERFFRGTKPQELRIQGSGLGLAIVKEIVELHGGMVEVDSVVGAGSTFTVWMPLISAKVT